MKKYKKWGLRIFGIAIVVFIVSRMGYVSYEKIYPIKLETAETDPQVIAEHLFQKELDKLASFKMQYSYRLAAYNIEEVLAKRNRDQTISFTIKYSVKPALGAYLYWSAGSGNEKGLWINDKICKGQIEYIDGVYMLKAHDKEE